MIPWISSDPAETLWMCIIGVHLGNLRLRCYARPCSGTGGAVDLKPKVIETAGNLHNPQDIYHVFFNLISCYKVIVRLCISKVLTKTHNSSIVSNIAVIL